MKFNNQVIILLFATMWNTLAIATPTTIPTASPSSKVPSKTPTFRPTPNPTITMAPTESPTKQTSPVVSFYSNVTLVNVAQSSLDSDSQTVVALTAAASMGLPNSAVNYITTVYQNTIVTRRLLNEEKITQDVSYQVIAVLHTQVSLSQTSYQSTNELYETSTSQLVTEVNNNQFTYTLQANAVIYGTPDLNNTEATSATSSTATVQYVEDTASNSSLGAGAVAGIIICVLFVVSIAAYCAYKRYTASSLSQPGRHITKGYVLNEDEEDAEIENPVHHRDNRSEIRDSKKIILNDLNI